ncbi:phosphate ABC transporter ATP-binding protein [Moorena bouillonii]|uniref:phosphate ABC transporter ATP-binding protein n=1 Tax=Moorena bouillonii TaxID=207920 RepID=UPI00096A715D|nr:phosphate ABC transporter ATP-binding protein [Moorena bouillonii]
MVNPLQTRERLPVSQSISDPLIQTERLCLHYGTKPAFADVSLPIYKGSITALVGPSGCGKTSFLSCLNRLTDLIPNAKVTGRIRIGSLDVLSPRMDAIAKRGAMELIALRRRVGMIFQKPSPFPFSIWKNLAFPLREHGVKNRDNIAQLIETALRDVGLWDEVKDRLHTSALALSGGQKQRLCIARALVLQPEVLLLDEPCSALDPISSGVVEDLIARLRGRYTLVIVTHNLAQARRIADYTAVFWVKEAVGRLIEYGCVEQIFESPQQALTAAYVNGMRG